MAKKVIIGTVTVNHDTEMHNNQFEYAGSFENLLVKAGTYPIYAYEKDLVKTKDGKVMLGWRNYIGYEGTVLEGNIGNKVGSQSSYHLMIYNYSLADCFTEGRRCDKYHDETYDLWHEWGIVLDDFVSSIDGRRIFTKDVVLKDGKEYTVFE